MEDCNNTENKANHGSLEAKKTNGNGVSDSKTFEEALEITRVGTYNYRLLAITIYTLIAAASELFFTGVVITSSQCDLDLDVAKKGLISSLPILGVVVSAHFWGFLADTRGRRFTLMISTTGTCVAGLIAAFSNNWIYLAILKFIGATFASGTNAIALTFVGEATIAAKRQAYLMYANAGMFSAQAIIAIVCYPILNLTFDLYMPLLGFSFRPWRLSVMAIGLVSFVSLLLIAFFTYESPKFYFAIGEHDKGLKIMQKIYIVNTGNTAEDYPVKHVVSNPKGYKTKNSFFRSVWDQTMPLFGKQYVKNTILVFLCGVPAFCVAPSFFIWLPFVFNAYSATQNPDIRYCDIFQKDYSQTTNSSLILECDDRVADVTLIALAIFAAGSTFCSLITVPIIKLLGKKWTFVLNHASSCIMCVLMNHIPILFGFAAMMGMMATSACIGIVTSYAIELFPTYMRAMAVCLCILFGRAVSIVFCNYVGAQLENNCDNFILIVAGLTMFGGIVGLFLPSDRIQKKEDVVKSPENCECNKNSTST